MTRQGVGGSGKGSQGGIIRTDDPREINKRSSSMDNCRVCRDFHVFFFIFFARTWINEGTGARLVQEK